MSRSNRKKPDISRRDWMRALGITGAASVAGCLGDDDDPGDGNGDDDTPGNGDDDTPGNGDDDTPTPEPDPADVRFNYMRGGVLFQDINWNTFSDNHNGSVKPYFCEIGAFTRDDNAEVEMVGFSDFSYDTDSQVLSITLRDDITFHNGDQYTAEDLWTWDQVNRLQNPEGSAYESIEQVDDYTLEYTLKDNVNQEIVYKTHVADRTFDFGARVWTEWLEQYQDASDQDERDAISEDLVSNFTVTSDEVVEEGYGNGAWIIDEVTEEYMDFVAYEDHFIHAGRHDEYESNFDRFRMWYADETGRRDQFIVNERIDAIGHNHSWSSYEDQLPDYWEQIYRKPRMNAYKMIINWRNREYLQDVNFRRAMAAAIDHQNAATNLEHFPVEMHSGMGQNFNEQYWGASIPDNLIDYGATAQPDLMQEYLDRSDYSIDGNVVVGPDGEEHDPMRFVIGGSTWGSVAQVSAAMLDQAGFPIEQNPVGRSNKLTIVQDNMGEWDLSTETHYASATHHPSSFFNPGSFWGWRIGPAGFGPGDDFTPSVEGWLEDGETHSPYNGKAMVFDIPSEPGTEELGSDTKEINLYEMYNEAISPVSEDRDTELIRDLSWAWNYMLPDIDITHSVADYFGNTQKLQFAEPDVVYGRGSDIAGITRGTIKLRSRLED